MNKIGLSGKLVAVAIAVVAMLFVSFASTLALIIVKTNELVNTFQAGEINITVNDDATITNSSEVPVYVRVAVVVNYQDNNGNVYHEAAVENTDYRITSTNAWIKGSDGFYYYTKPVNATNGATSALPTVTTLAIGNNSSKLNYKLVTTYVATGIQGSPTSAVVSAWGVTLDANGNITAVN